MPFATWKSQCVSWWRAYTQPSLLVRYTRSCARERNFACGLRCAHPPKRSHDEHLARPPDRQSHAEIPSLHFRENELKFFVCERCTSARFRSKSVCAREFRLSPLDWHGTEACVRMTGAGGWW